MTGLHAIESASRDELQALQTERLAATLRQVYAAVPHYRRAFDAAGVHPQDFRTLADLQRFPFTVKADLRDNYPFALFAVPAHPGCPCARLLRHHRQAHRRGLHGRRPRHVGPMWSPARCTPLARGPA